MAQMIKAPETTLSTGEFCPRLKAEGRRQLLHPSSLQPPASSYGITLIELLVVLGIIALVVGIGVPAMTGYAKQMRLKTATRQVVGLLSLARSLAISSHADHAVSVDRAQHEVTVMNTATEEPLEQRVRLPEAITVDVRIGDASSSETQVVFRSTGALVGRSMSLVLANDEKSHTVTITGPTGAITVQ